MVFREREMERKTTSIKVEPQLWKETKKLAIDRGIAVSELVESALKKELQRK
jgi:post-segregation antitoxin (ccd killing protein)